MKKHEKVIGFLVMTSFLLLMGFVLGIHYSNNKRYQTFHQGKQSVLKDIKHGIDDGYIFLMKIEDSEEFIKFIPRKDGAVSIAGAGGDTLQTGYANKYKGRK